MKASINDLLLLGLVSFTYWVHVLSQGQQAYPPGVPPPSGVPPQQYQQQQQFQQPQPQYQGHQQYQHHPNDQMQFQQPPPQMMNQGQFQQPPVQHMQQQQQFQPPPAGMPQQQYHGQPPQHAGQHAGQPPQHAGQPPQHAGQPHHQAGQPHHQAGQPHHHDFNKESHDKDHIAEHLRDVVNKPVEQMTEEEMEFHYFKLHDYDNNNKLDGTEITKALTHFEREGHQDPTQPIRTLSDAEIAEIVDAVLKEDDLNGDGYVEYSEFVVAQRKARVNMPAQSKGSEAQDQPNAHH